MGLFNSFIVKKLIKELKHKDDQVRRYAAEALGKMGDARAVEPLIQALKDETGFVANRAALALGEIGDARAVEPLIESMKYKGGYVRGGAAQALGELGDKRAVEPLINALKADISGYAPRQTAQALGELGDPMAIEPLIQALRDEDSSLREVAAKSLDKLGWYPGDNIAKVYCLIAKKQWKEFTKIGKPAVELLIQALKDEDYQVRGGAAEALREIGDKRAVEPLINVLKADKNSHVRWGAAVALGEIGDKRAVEPLINALKADKDSRRGAANALGELKDTRAVEPLINVLKADKDFHVRGSAANALGEIGDPRAIEPLIHALKDDNGEVRDKVANALGEIGDSRAIEPLIQAQEDELVRPIEAKFKEIGDSMTYGIRNPWAISNALEKIKAKVPQEEDYANVAKALFKRFCSSGTVDERIRAAREMADHFVDPWLKKPKDNVGKALLDILVPRQEIPRHPKVADLTGGRTRQSGSCSCVLLIRIILITKSISGH